MHALFARLGAASVLLLALVPRLAVAAPITFEDVADGTALGAQYAGVQFENARVISAGISLDEFEFPPRSGANVAFDDSGEMVLRFASPLQSFGAWFTYAEPLRLTGYDADGAMVGVVLSLFGSNMALSGDLGSMANEWLGFEGWLGVTRIVIGASSAGGSFTIDDVAFRVPEPPATVLVAAALLALALLRRRGARVRRGALLAALGLGTAWSAAAQEVAQPVVVPGVLHTTATVLPQRIVVSAAITDPAGTLLANGVNLLHVRPDGTSEIVGALNDAGFNGDEVAGDGIFGAAFSSAAYPFNRFGAAPGVVPLRVSAPYRGLLLRKLSPLARLELIEPGLPDDIRPSDLAHAVWDPSLQREVICTEVLFTAPPGAPAATLRQAAAAVNGTLVGLLPGSDVNTWQVDMPCNGAAGVRAAVDQLEDSTGLRGAGPNTVGQLAGVPKPNDPRFDDQYALANVQARKAWTITTGTHPHFPAAIPGRRIAIVDSGVDHAHPDLQGKVVLGKNYAVNPPTRQPTDNLGHGTHVAGIAAANTANGAGIAGACWTCTIVAVKVIDGAEDPRLRTTALQLAAGIRDASYRGAHVINLSLQNFNRDEDVARQIHDAVRAGALVVAAAGNSHTDAFSYPGAYADSEVFVHRFFQRTYAPRVITVGATDAARQRAAFSNYGDWLELYAPGDAVLSTLPGAAYGELDGTSMATPLVSGVAALASVNRSSFDTAAVRTALLTSTLDTGNDDPNGLRIRELDAFGAVFQGMASACGRCPEVPDVLLVGTTVLLGQGVAGPQARSRHGVSVPLRAAGPAQRYVVSFRFDLHSFDAYVPTAPGTGYFDVFSLSLSSLPYYHLNLGDPLALRPDFTPTFTFSGTQRGGTATTGWRQLSLPIAARAVNHLNLMLDTAGLPDSDRLHWSGGTFQLLDITPE